MSNKRNVVGTIAALTTVVSIFVGEVGVKKYWDERQDRAKQNYIESVRDQ